MNYSLHTVELRKYLSESTFSRLVTWIYNDSKGHYRVDRNAYGVIPYRFIGQGIEINLKAEKYRRYLAVRLSLNSILNGPEPVTLVEQQDIAAAYELASKKISDWLGEEFTLDAFLLWRVDFCVNLNVGSPRAVEEYIALMYKTKKKKAFAERGLKNKNIVKSRSYTARKGNDLEISIYDKQKALNAQNCARANLAEGILRVELRVLNSRTVDLYVPVGDNAQRIVRCATISRNVITTFMEDFCMNADYYTLDKAKRIVDDKVASEKMRERMKCMLERTACLHGIRNAKKSLVGSKSVMSHDYYNKMMEEFERINVNAVTLAKNGEVKYMPSLFRYIYEI